MRSLRELLKEQASVPSSGAKAAAAAVPALPEATMRGLVAALTSDELVHLLEWEAVARGGVAAHSW